MTSKITLHSVNIDAAYPIAGINQSSQGFRDNFDAIKTALTTGAGEITNLQAKAISVTGDVTGTSAAFGETGSATSIALTLGTVLSNPGAFDTATHSLAFTFDSKGRVTGVTATALASGVSAGTEYGPSGTSLGSGTGTIDFPTFTFDASGRTTAAGTETLSYGLIGHPFARGQLLAGDSNSESALVPVPPAFNGSYFLVASGNGATGLEWTSLDSAGGITGVSAGPGIAVTGSNPPTVGLDLTNLSAAVSVLDGDLFAAYSTNTFDTRRVSFGDIRTSLENTFMRRLDQDVTPALGGDLDVKSFAITSTDPAGVVIDNTNGITVGGSAWPATLGLDGQVLTTDGAGNLAWAGAANLAYANTVFVSSERGDDANGNGGSSSPYQTIATALANIVSADNWTIVLQGGTYSENITLDGANAESVRIVGESVPHKPVLTGIVSVGTGSVGLRFSNVVFDRTAEDDSNLDPAFEVSAGAGEIVFEDCDFFRGGGTKSDLTIVRIIGDVTRVTFESCAFQGILEISASGTGHQVVISNTRQIGDMTFGVITGSNLQIVNALQIKGITHLAGELLLDNVSYLLNDSKSVSIPNPPVWQVDGSNNPIIVPGSPTIAWTPVLNAAGKPIQNTNNLGQPLYEDDGVTPLYKMTDKQQAFTTSSTTSTKDVALYSTASTGSVTLRKVNLFKSGAYATVIKTGLAAWSFEDVNHRAEQDVLMGPRITYDSDVNSGDFLPRLIANGAGLTYADDARTIYAEKLDPRKSRFYHVTLTGNSNITLLTPRVTNFTTAPAANSGEMATTIQVAVEQDGTGGHTLVWGADGGPGILWNGDVLPDPEAGSTTLYTFYYFSISRRWIGVKTSTGAATTDTLSVADVASTSYTPTLADAGKYIRLADDTEATFQVPLHSSVAFPVGTQIHIVQAGNGKVLINNASGVTVNSPSGLKSLRPYSLIVLTKVAANIWDLSGDTDEATYRADQDTIKADDTTFTLDTV